MPDHLSSSRSRTESAHDAAPEHPHVGVNDALRDRLRDRFDPSREESAATRDRGEGGSGSRLEVHLYVRSLAAAEGSPYGESAIERLEALEAAGVVDAHEIEIWGADLVLSTADATPVGERILDRLERFQTWIEENGCSFGPAWRIRDRSSWFGDRSPPRLVLPTVILAEYEDGRLRHLAPCADGEELVTVRQRLEAIGADAESGRRPVPVPASQPGASVHRDGNRARNPRGDGQSNPGTDATKPRRWLDREGPFVESE